MKNELNAPHLSAGMVLQLPPHPRSPPEKRAQSGIHTGTLFETALARPRYRFNINGKADGRAERKEIEGK